MFSRKSAIVLLLATAFVSTPLTAPSSAFSQDRPDSYRSDYPPRGMEELKDLAAPVALYPDALLAQVLVACSYPLDVVSASQWLDAGHDPARIDDQPWDDSVKGVARYPETLRYLAAHVDWMNDIGDAFIHQESDVMTAVQLLRAQANAAGNLVSDERQEVIVDGDIIEIIPANPDVIYVPEYDPRVVYVERGYEVGRPWRSLITFGIGVHVGSWLHEDCDWRDRAIYRGDWGRDRPWWHDVRREGNRFYRDEGHRYNNDRPGVYVSRNVTNIRNTTIINNRTNVRNTNVVESTRWQHDDHKPAPRPVRTAEHNTATRAGSGYPAARTGAERPGREPAAESPRNVAIPEQGHGGAVTARESSRGERSRQSAAPQATPRETPAPRSEAPARSEPAPRAERPARSEPAPTPAPRAERPARSEPTPAPRAEAPARSEPAPRAERPARSEPAPRSGGEGGARTGADRGYQSGADASRSSERGASSRGDSGGGDHRH